MPGLNYEERLRRLTIYVADDAWERTNELVQDAQALDSRTLSLARLAALIAVGGSVPSYSEMTDAAVSAGATPEEAVDILVGIADVVGLPRIVEAAPAMALGYDVDAAFEASESG